MVESYFLSHAAVQLVCLLFACTIWSGAGVILNDSKGDSLPTLPSGQPTILRMQWYDFQVKRPLVLLPGHPVLEPKFPHLCGREGLETVCAMYWYVLGQAWCHLLIYMVLPFPLILLSTTTPPLSTALNPQYTL